MTLVFKMEENGARNYERVKNPAQLFRLLLQHKYYVQVEQFTHQMRYYRPEPFDLSELQYWLEAELGKLHFMT